MAIWRSGDLSNSITGGGWHAAALALVLWAALLSGSVGAGGLAGCAKSAETAVVVEGQAFAWRAVYQGIDAVDIVATQPRPLRVYAVRIDLHAPGIHFLVTPAAQDDGTMLSLNTSSFLEKYHCQVALNGSPFAGVVEQEGQPQLVVGLNLSQGVLTSPADARYGAMLITRDNQVRFVQPPFAVGDAWNGLGGFSLLLRAGQVLRQDNDVLHPRTAAGTSRDGRWLYLLVIDGRQPNYSEGVSLAETAQWLQRLGAWDGLNLDGGGSSALVFADAHGQARVQNCPIDRKIPGTERPVANHLGVFAPPLR